MKKWIVFLGMFGAGVLPVTPVLACSAAGPDAHMGRVASVDVEAGEFTIKDFESGKFITFRASEEILRQVQGRATPLAVKFHTDDAALIAFDVE